VTSVQACDSLRFAISALERFSGSVVQVFDLLAQFLYTDRFIAILAALLLRSNDNAGRQVPKTNGAFGFVHVLSSGSA
jgi:hypothetical protein